MLTINFGSFPVLTTDRLKLRAITQNDVPQLFELRSSPEVMKYADRALAASTDEVEKTVESIVKSFKDNDAISWAITLKNDPTLIGNIGFWKIDKAHHRGEIGYMLHPSQQGKGLMQEALAAAVQYAFNTIKLHSIEANVNPNNAASKKLLGRNGFVQEAYFRENYFYDGKFLDSAIYSLITPVDKQ